MFLVTDGWVMVQSLAADTHISQIKYFGLNSQITINHTCPKLVYINSLQENKTNTLKMTVRLCMQILYAYNNFCMDFVCRFCMHITIFVWFCMQILYDVCRFCMQLLITSILLHTISVPSYNA